MIDINYQPKPGEFNIRRYWMDRSSRYWSEDRLHGDAAHRQESFIVSTVRGINPRTILEVGCGYGRITKALATTMPTVHITGIDISPDQIEHAHGYCYALHNVQLYIGDVSIDPLPQADVAIAVELLLHYPTDEATMIVRRLLDAAPVLIHEIEPKWKRTDKVCCHVFWHDYEEIYRDLASIEYVERDEHCLLIARRYS